MAEPLLGSAQIVAEVDAEAGLQLMRSWVAGPAGTAVLRLAGGIELDVDVAWPSRLAELRVPQGPRAGDATSRAMNRLLGPREPRGVDLQQWELRTRRGPQLDDLGYERARRESGVSPVLQRAALAHLVAAEAPSPLARAVALLEASLFETIAGRGLGLGRAASVDAQMGASQLLDVMDSDRLVVTSEVALELAPLLRRVTRVLPRSPLQDRLLAVAVDLDAGRHERPHVDPPFEQTARLAPAMAPPAAAPAAGAPRFGGRRMHAVRSAPPVPVDRRTLPSMWQHASVVARRESVSEIEVRVIDEPARAEGCWTRAIDADGTVLALTPLRARGDDAAGTMLVSPDRIFEVRVDVTDQPAIRPPSRALDTATAAIVAGRAAARSERLGLRVMAAAEWHECAARWDEIEDETRASTARSYAVQSDRGAGRIPAPLLADRL